MSAHDRIQVVHLLYRLGLGGVEQQLVSLACSLPRERFRQSLITAIPGGIRGTELAAAGVELICMPRRGPLDLAYIAAVRRFLREREPDIINTRGMGTSVWWQLLGRQNRRPPACVVTRSAFEVRASALTRWLAVRQLQFADQVVANSRGLQEQLEQQHPFLRGQVRLIRNGVDCGRFAQPVDREAVLRREGLDPGVPLVLSAGRLHPLKDFALFVDAAASLREAGTEAQFAVVGDGDERAALQQRIADRGLGGRFHLLPARERIEELLQTCVVFVLPSRSESSNNALMEALAAGRACVSTKVSGSPELLGAGAHGQLVEIGDAAGLAAAIGRYLADPQLASAHGEAGREHMRCCNSLQDCAAAYGEIFERLAASRRG